MNRSILRNTLIATLIFSATPAFAYEKGDWAVSLGAHQVNPDSNNGTLAAGAFDTNVGSDVKLTFTGEYFIADQWGIEVLAALPFEHTVKLNGVEAATVKHLPPTFSLQYHFKGEKISPFIGLGINYTTFFSIKEKGPLAGTNLDLENSWGLAAHAGLDFAINDNQFIRIDIRKIDIDTKARLNGSNIGTVNIDPMIYGAAYVWRF
jgi:outer membrane protein